MAITAEPPLTTDEGLDAARHAVSSITQAVIVHYENTLAMLDAIDGLLAEAAHRA